MSKKRTEVNINADWIIWLAFIVTLVVVMVFFSSGWEYDKCGNIRQVGYMSPGIRVWMVYTLGFIVWIIGRKLIEEKLQKEV